MADNTSQHSQVSLMPSPLPAQRYGQQGHALPQKQEYDPDDYNSAFTQNNTNSNPAKYPGNSSHLSSSADANNTITIHNSNAIPGHLATPNNYIPYSNINNISPQPAQAQMQQLTDPRQALYHGQHQARAQPQAQDSLLQDSERRHQTPQQQKRSSHDEPPEYYYPPQPSSNSQPASLTGPEDNGTFASRIKRLFHFPCSTYGKAMILVIAIEALLVIILQAVIVSLYFQSLINTALPPPTVGPNAGIPMAPYLDPRNQSRSIPAYLIVFVFAQLFQLIFAWDAVRAQNTIELIGIVMFNLCCFAYSIFEISQIRLSLWNAGQDGFFVPDTKAMDLNRTVNPILIVVVCMIGITQCLVTWLAYQLFQEFGWKIYKKIGADPNMKKMYRAYQIYLVLIKVDLFFFVGFSIQFIYLTLIKRGEDPEYWLTIIVLPITILILYVAVYAVRHESRKWMATFFLAMICGVVYFVFKVIRMYVGPKKDNYIGVQKFLTLFASLCLITILLTIANAAICFRNFGKGLKPHLMRDGRGESLSKTSPTGGIRNMVID